MVELVAVIVVLGVLAAVATSRWIDLSQSARIASVKAMRAAIIAAAENVHAACLATSDCRDQMGGSFDYYFDGHGAQMNYGWLDAGDNLGQGQIDVWVDRTGFTATLTSGSTTRFELDGAPNPANCSATYTDAYLSGPASSYTITTTTTGC